MNVNQEELLKLVILFQIHENLQVDLLVCLILPYKFLDANQNLTNPQ